MKIAEYFEAVKDHLFAASFVADFKILKQMDRSKNGHLRARMTFTDNTPHFPNLENFPHHIHLEDDVISSKPVNIFDVLNDIAKTIANR